MRLPTAPGGSSSSTVSLRKAIFWIHLAVGVTAAVVIFMMAATGVILTYEAQLDRWALRGYRADPPAAGVAPLELDALIARVAGGPPAGPVTSVTLRRDPREPAVVRFDGGATVHADRFTGEQLGDGETRTRRFLRSVLYWHRWFALEGEYRIVGRTFTATANLGFLFLLVSGVCLWWPSAGNRAAWRRALWFRRGLGGRARDFNWHGVIGFWSAAPLAVIVASGATISYQWAADVVHRLAGDTPPFQTSPRWSASVTRNDLSAAPDPATPPVELQALVASAVAETPGWRTMTVSLPESNHEPVVVAGRPRDGPPAVEERGSPVSTGRPARGVASAGYPTFSRGFKGPPLVAVCAHRRGVWRDRPVDRRHRVPGRRGPGLDRSRNELAPFLRLRRPNLTARGRLVRDER